MRQEEEHGALPQQKSSPTVSRRTKYFLFTAFPRQPKHILVAKTRSSKAVHLEFLSPKERLYLTNHYINYCERTILHMQPETQVMQ